MNDDKNKPMDLERPEEAERLCNRAMPGPSGPEWSAVRDTLEAFPGVCAALREAWDHRDALRILLTAAQAHAAIDSQAAREAIERNEDMEVDHEVALDAVRAERDEISNAASDLRSWLPSGADTGEHRSPAEVIREACGVFAGIMSASVVRPTDPSVSVHQVCKDRAERAEAECDALKSALAEAKQEANMTRACMVHLEVESDSLRDEVSELREIIDDIENDSENQDFLGVGE